MAELRPPRRIEGSYPPPPPRRPSGPARGTTAPGSRHRAPRAVRPSPARAWAGLSVLLTVLGSTALVLPTGADHPTRLDRPVAVSPAGATAAVHVPQLALDLPVTPDDAVAPPPAPPAGPAASVPVRVQVPALGLRADVVRLGLAADGTMQLPPDGDPVGWFEGGPTPGEQGPAVLAGHVDWAGDPGAFAGLAELVAGDEVVVDRADGSQLVFRVDRVETHPKSAFPTEAVYGDTAGADLRLITCGGAFDEDAGDYRDNVVVFAALVPPG
ncbi:class F sortase [Goekera deserti]|uniref:class F sortase n=1 Tax=Goekera deserti TaxID=2497753 RepID=UPI001F212E8F|nr:class F sortase [Goekera deserti]